MEKELLEMAAQWKETALEMIQKSDNGSRPPSSGFYHSLHVDQSALCSSTLFYLVFCIRFILDV
jgi:hypothetical protein